MMATLYSFSVSALPSQTQLYRYFILKSNCTISFTTHILCVCRVLALRLQSVVQNQAQQMAIVLLDSGFVVLFREFIIHF